MTEFQIPTVDGNSILPAVPGRPLFIVGRNGTGKSALVHTISQQAGSRTAYLPGSRTSHFDAEGLGLTPAGRKAVTSNLRSWDSSPDTRWRNISGNVRNEKAVHDLIASEHQYKNDIANAISMGIDVQANIDRLQAKASPLDKVNLLLTQSNIPVRMATANGELIATIDGGHPFSFARMSDGERSALVLIAEVIEAPSEAIFVIDEPELHMHRAIVVPLIAALIKSRPECEFVISTHELELPGSVPDARVCVVRHVTWRPDGAVQNWDIDVVENAGSLPAELSIDILGSRRRVLFTEGTDASLDLPMYAVLFPEASVRPKGGCHEVRQAVAGLRSTAALHHTQAYGLIDNDGMTREQVAELQAAGVYPLPVFSVESLYYHLDVLRSVADRQAATMTSKEETRAELATTFVQAAIRNSLSEATANQSAEQLAGRVAEAHVRDAILKQLPRRAALVASGSAPITVTSASPYAAELSRLHRLVSQNDFSGIVGRYPIRHTGIPAAVAKALKFQSSSDYEAAAVACVAAQSALQDELRALLSPLTDVLTD